MSRVDVDGVGIEYQVTGEGRPVVLLHGFPDSGRLWRHQVPALAAAGFQVIVPDLRGYGGSSKPEAVDAYSLTLLAGDVLAVLAGEQISRAHVVGHDWGAALAWVLATFAPDQVDHLAVLSVGHPATFLRTLEQRQMSWYMLLFQFPGSAERWLTEDNWANFRSWARHPDADQVIADLEATGSLTPGLNWYRANIPARSVGRAAAPAAARAGPGHGHLEHRRYGPQRSADDRLRPEHGRSLALRAPGGPRSLDATRRPRPGQPAAARLPGPLAMADAEDVRRLALALPHVEEIDSDGFDFRVAGRGFVWSYPERRPGKPRVIRTDIAVLYVGDEAEKQALLLGEPAVFFTTSSYDGWPLVMLRLTQVDAERLAELVTDAWRMRVPDALAGEPGEAGGQPAPDETGRPTA